MSLSLAKLEPWSYVHRQIAMELSNRSGVDVGPGVKQLYNMLSMLKIAWPNLSRDPPWGLILASGSWVKYAGGSWETTRLFHLARKSGRVGPQAPSSKLD